MLHLPPYFPFIMKIQPRFRGIWFELLWIWAPLTVSRGGCLLFVYKFQCNFALMPNPNAYLPFMLSLYRMESCIAVGLFYFQYFIIRSISFCSRLFKYLRYWACLFILQSPIWLCWLFFLPFFVFCGPFSYWRIYFKHFPVK